MLAPSKVADASNPFWCGRGYRSGHSARDTMQRKALLITVTANRRIKEKNRKLKIEKN